MARKYTKRKRADQESDTRRRIAQAALDLHRVQGPARTSLSQVAEKAQVQRHTLYAHFPDEKSLFLACSALHLEQEPPPDATAWQAIADRRERLRAGLGAIYGWFERNEGLLACVLRDAEYHDLTREILRERFGPTLASWHASLDAEDDPPPVRAMLALALSFHSWRTLTRECGLDSAAAAGIMAERVLPGAR